MQELRSILQKLLIVAVSISAIAFAVIHFSEQPCSKPVTFTLDTVDSRFNIAKSTVTANLQDVALLWNKALPETKLLQFVDSNADVVISFVYDERQRTTIRNERLKRQIAQQKSELSNLRSSIDTTQSVYDSKNQAIQTETESYLKRLQAYKDQVDEWNKKGGAPAGVYESLKQEQVALELERININNDIADLNKLAETIKDTSGKHNAIVADVNEKVDTINNNTEREFEEGVYDPNSKTITIYEFEDPLSLKRVLAHELGHALGLGHVTGKDSIMYSYNDSKTFELSPEDIGALKTVCRRK